MKTNKLCYKVSFLTVLVRLFSPQNVAYYRFCLYLCGMKKMLNRHYKWKSLNN